MLADAPIYPTIPVTDKEKADAFYGGTLGFKPAVEDAGGTMYQAGDGTRFLVFLAGSPSSGDHTLVGWQVDDIEAEVAELKQRGVRFEEYDTRRPPGSARSRP
jgi:catechol 2,3-dioxygenase-like lactoylglutathione lyase family enzyme